jgi:exopolysaccharide biosynthesis WecB/TagA/CpsF family protein
MSFQSYKRILGVDILDIDRTSAIQLLLSKLKNREISNVFFVNAHSLNISCADNCYRDVLGKAIVFCDGLGVDIASSWIYGSKFTDNLNGTDFIPEFFAESEEPLRLFLLGGEEGVADRAASTISETFPLHQVVGTHHGFVQDEPIEQLLRAINDTNPDVLLVAMGNPLQEKWIIDNRDKLEVPLAFGVGALLDFLSGTVVRAPGFILMLRCEWVWRLIQEPRRLFVRYLIGNPLFLYRVFRYRRNSP